MSKVRLNPKDDQPLKPAMSVNLTHLSHVMKVLPKSSIPDDLKKSADGHKVFVEKISRDATKTESMKELLVRQDANKRISSLTERIDSVYQNSQGQIAELSNQISQKWEIKGTTDFLILQNQASVLKDMKFSEVLNLIQAGDVNTLRCLQLPVMQHNFKLSEPQRKGQLEHLKEATLLDSQQQDLLNQCRAAVDALSSMGDGLLAQVGENGNVIHQIQSNIVEVANQ